MSFKKNPKHYPKRKRVRLLTGMKRIRHQLFICPSFMLLATCDLISAGRKVREVIANFMINGSYNLNAYVSKCSVVMVLLVSRYTVLVEMIALFWQNSVFS